jgi:hypothetical protein
VFVQGLQKLFVDYNSNKNRKDQFHGLSYFAVSCKGNGCLVDEEGKRDERSKKYGSQGSNAGKIFLGIGIVGVELGTGRRDACHDGCRLGCSFVFLSHFISPSFVIAQRQQCAVYQQDMDSMRLM